MDKTTLPSIKDLKDYTDLELRWFLDNNQSVDTRVLACICSEILRRTIIMKNIGEAND